MGKGSRRHRTTNRKKQKMQKKSQNPKTSDLNPNETKTDISSISPILQPGTPEYKTALEQIYGKPGPPEGFGPLPQIPEIQLKETKVAAKTGSIDNKDRRSIIMFRDHHLVFPELWLRVLILGPPEDTRGFNHLFARASCKQATSLEDADLVVFTGGPDVDPAYYMEEGENPHPSCYVDPERDAADAGKYLACVEQGIPMVGVCRGAQFLAVMNGHKLFQDIDGHQSDHKMYCHRTKKVIERVSSRHHQCVRPGNGTSGLEIIAWSNVSTCKYMTDKLSVEARNNESPLLDVEAFFIRDTCCFGVQGHPEYKGYHAFAQWFLESIYHLIYINPDMSWDKDTQRLRMRPEILQERQMLEIHVEQGVN